MREPGERVELVTEVGCLLLDLFIEDQRGGRPSLGAGSGALARRWLARVLTDSGARRWHLETLESHYARVTPTAVADWPFEDRPCGRVVRPVFRHRDPLRQEQALAVCADGLSVLNDEEVAHVLLNPVALADLADLIDATLSDYWLDRLGEEEPWDEDAPSSAAQPEGIDARARPPRRQS